MNRKPLSDEILSETRTAWDEMQTHRFVRDIEADQLPDDVFKRYLAYENAFVETAILIFGYCMLKAPSLEEKRWLIGVLKALSEEQIDYFHRTFETLGMKESDWRDVPLPPAVSAFRDGMLVIAAHGTYVEGITAMFAAEWMYWTWSDRAAKKPISNPKLKEWVDLHAAQSFADQALWLRAQIDKAGESMPEAARRTTAGIFRRALELEIDFHSAAYDH